MKIPPESIGMGGIIGALISAMAVIWGLYIKRDTTLATRTLDSRDKLTQDTAAQLDAAIDRAEDCEKLMRVMHSRSDASVSLLARMEAEVVGMNNRLVDLDSYMQNPTLDKEFMLRQQASMRAACNRMQKSLDQHRGFVIDAPEPPPPPQGKTP